jgi:hypothetical protein
MQKYIPPHRRQKQQEVSLQEILLLPCSARCKEWLFEGESVCLHHKFNRRKSTLKIAEYFNKEPVFIKWLQCKKQTGQGHPLINKCFARKVYSEQKEDQLFGKRSSSVQVKVCSLFNRFLRYAADIDNGTNYAAKAAAVANLNQDFCFLDLGFAPGGMVALLLDAHPKIRGIGVNLAPEKGGNVYPLFLDHVYENETFLQAYKRCQNQDLESMVGNLSFSGDKRFKSIEMDVIELAQSGLDLLNLEGFKVNNAGLDLCIVGITTSGSNQEGEMDELDLKNLLHFAQLLLGLKFLKPGGQLLIRLHLGLRLVDLHILALLLECFENHVVTKPYSEFAMRKTIWLHCDGYVYSQDAIDRITVLINQKDPYAESTVMDDSTGDYQLNNASLVNLSIDEIFSNYGEQILKLLAPMWEAQYLILMYIMQGKSARLCYECRSGRSDCTKCYDAAPLCVIEAVRKVNEKLSQTNENLIL